MFYFILYCLEFRFVHCVPCVFWDWPEWFENQSKQVKLQFKNKPTDVRIAVCVFSHYFTNCPPWMPYRAQRVPSQFLQQLLYDNMWNPSLIFYCQCLNAKNGKNGLIQHKITVEAHLMAQTKPQSVIFSEGSPFDE